MLNENMKNPIHNMAFKLTFRKQSPYSLENEDKIFGNFTNTEALESF